MHSSPSAEKRIYHLFCDTCLFVKLDPLDFVSRDIQAIDKPLQLLGVAGFAFNIRDQSLGRQGCKDTLVVDFDDIDIMLVEKTHNLKQRAGPILQC
jgi:hypothetical protein